VLRLRNRIVGGFIAAVGLVFLAVGVYLLITSGWATATATVTSCQSRIAGTGSSRHSESVCQVTWTDAGVAHAGSVTMAGRAVGAGRTLSVRVHGDQVALPSPLWVRLGTLGVGLAAVTGGLVLALRRPRADRRRLS
jgi:hypothetical protein